METVISHSPTETKQLADKILKKKSRVIGLVGDLGSGKTTFAQGLAKALGIRERIISPTFVLIRQYQIPKTCLAGRRAKDQRPASPAGGLKTRLYHVDLYRLDGKIDILSLGLPEIWTDSQNLIVIEWAEKIKEQLPEKTLIIEFENLGGEKRKIKINDLKN